MILVPRIQGKVNFTENSVRVSDPCYDSSVWCTLDVPVKPGEYTCVSWRGTDRYKDKESGKRYSDTRTMIIGVYLDGFIPSKDDFEKSEILGNIGVDAGMAGFYQNKPDFTRDEWMDFCEVFCRDVKKHCRIDPYGFTSKSGYGDGMYDVRGYKNADGETIALEIECCDKVSFYN